MLESNTVLLVSLKVRWTTSLQAFNFSSASIILSISIPSSPHPGLKRKKIPWQQCCFWSVGLGVQSGPGKVLVFSGLGVCRSRSGRIPVSGASWGGHLGPRRWQPGQYFTNSGLTSALSRTVIPPVHNEERQKLGQQNIFHKGNFTWLRDYFLLCSSFLLFACVCVHVCICVGV